VTLDDRYHGLARARHITADDNSHPVLEDQLFRKLCITAWLALRIEADEFNFATQDATCAIDFRGREHGGLQLGGLDSRGHA
jgi:hypothetical protein